MRHGLGVHKVGGVVGAGPVVLSKSNAVVGVAVAVAAVGPAPVSGASDGSAVAANARVDAEEFKLAVAAAGLEGVAMVVERVPLSVVASPVAALVDVAAVAVAVVVATTAESVAMEDDAATPEVTSVAEVEAVASVELRAVGTTVPTGVVHEPAVDVGKVVVV